jgi:ABC-type nitrate/sulfonate/bicarbonate transport system permease component
MADDIVVGVAGASNDALETNMSHRAYSVSRSQATGLTLAGIGTFLAIWYGIVLLSVVPKTFLPAPHDVIQELARLIREPFVGHTLGRHLVSSFERFFYGFILAVTIGVPLGLLMALSLRVQRVISPLFESIRFVAPIAWVPFAALWFGTGIGGPILVIFMGAFAPVLINTFRGASYIERKYIEAARMLGAGPLRMMVHVLLPASLPSIVAGLRISAGLGWQSLVGAELIVASSGIGYMMVKGQASIQTSTVMAGMIAIGLVGLMLDILLRVLEKRVSRYKENA